MTPNSLQRIARGVTHSWGKPAVSYKGPKSMLTAYEICAGGHDSLKAGQCPFESDHPAPMPPRGISKEMRADALERNQYTCQMCGHGTGDPDPFDPGRKTRLVVEHIRGKSKGGPDDASGLRVLCTNCNEGLQNAGPMKPDRIQLLTQIRRATISDQRHVLEWLQTKFKK